MSNLHAMPITNITHSACYTVEMGASARDLTRITLDNNHTAYKHICLQVIGCVCVKNYPPEIMQPSSSTRATIVSAENQNGATIVKATYFFCHYYIVWESNNAREAWGQSWNESLNPDESQEDRAVIRVVQSENLLLRFLRRGHADDGCSCNHRAVPPSGYSECEDPEGHQCMSLEMAWRTRPLQLVLCGGPVTPTPTIEYNENTMDWEVKIGVHSRSIQENLKKQHNLDYPLYFQDDLTPRRAKLAYYVRQLKRNGKLSDIWVTETKIIAKDLHNKIHTIKSYSDLEKF